MSEEKMERYFFRASASDFKKIPDSLVAYWVSESTFKTFGEVQRLEELARPRKGMVTARNTVDLREWFEVDHHRLGFGHQDRQSAESSGCKWFPYVKGGSFRRWYGNRSEVVDWEHDGKRLRTTQHPTEDRVWATNFNLDYIFRPNVNRSDVRTPSGLTTMSPTVSSSSCQWHGILLTSKPISASWPVEVKAVHGKKAEEA